MLLIEYVGHIGLSSLTDGHLGRHLEYFKTLNDARVASVGFIKYNASTTRINKEKNFKIKFQVIQVFYRTNILDFIEVDLSFLLFMFRVCNAFLSVHCSLVVTCCERANLLALLCVMFYCALSLPRAVSWVRCGACLYRFLIFVSLLNFTIYILSFELINPFIYSVICKQVYK